MKDDIEAFKRQIAENFAGNFKLHVIILNFVFSEISSLLFMRSITQSDNLPPSLIDFQKTLKSLIIIRKFRKLDDFVAKFNIASDFQKLKSKKFSAFDKHS